ncbi:glutamate receptor ionotropic, kainate 2 [Eurytemora carolleeae]|uniref:glutamate receptor ionotropic, kainate 2 n=1 Tax=Eurytemora carolleeae TaxID=1294199 RepID=UPI000C76A16E|nr:glutamate receptor ionotropic, kainate 2 [Eurytemora carolleeae]|eukprot:XP_023347283.1 glutamate receptor ionotropic, kainate 2-like [Eurytemora affinis]
MNNGFSPHEWANPHPCLDTGFVVQNDFTLPNSFWFAVGTLMQQGSDLNPRAASTRIIGGIWWFFSLIIISSYTANLAAFLTVERMATPIENAEDLADQSTIYFGTLKGGSTMTFFRDSNIETYQKMWRYMESKEPSVFTATYKEGVERVKKGNYAFLCESAMLDYFVQRDCNLTQIGGLIDSKGYGIATPKGSRWRDKISQAILLLHEKSVMQMLYDKWWKLELDEGLGQRLVCPNVDPGLNKASALNVVNIGGVFVVLLCGLSFAILVAIVEFLVKSRDLKDQKLKTRFFS